MADKNISLPPSGLPDDFDMSKLGTSGVQPSAPRKPKGSSLPPWQWILAALFICGGITYIGSILPDTPEQIAASQTAFVRTATTVFATSVSKSATKPVHTKTVTPTSAATTAPTQTAKLKTYYAGSSGANLRSCPRTSCGTVTSLIAGVSISSSGEVEGDAVNAGNTVWYRVSYEGNDAYVYSGVVSTTKPTTATGGTTSNSGGSAGRNTGSGGNSTTNSSPATVPQSVPSAAPQQWDCSGDIYNCSSFNSRAEMNAYFAACPGDPSNLDGNGDGAYCESN